MHRDRLYYTSPGYLSGRAPNGESIIAGHERAGDTGYVLLWHGCRYARYGQQQLERDFGIVPREKQTGGQAGYPSEPVLRAAWRTFVDRYNAGDPAIVYSSTVPALA